MRVTRVAKLFKNGASHAVRRPVEFQFDRYFGRVAGGLVAENWVG